MTETQLGLPLGRGPGVFVAGGFEPASLRIFKHLLEICVRAKSTENTDPERLSFPDG
jgi:hypothetical protein